MCVTCDIVRVCSVTDTSDSSQPLSQPRPSPASPRTGRPLPVHTGLHYTLHISNKGGYSGPITPPSLRCFAGFIHFQINTIQVTFSNRGWFDWMRIFLYLPVRSCHKILDTVDTAQADTAEGTFGHGASPYSAHYLPNDTVKWKWYEEILVVLVKLSF